MHYSFGEHEKHANNKEPVTKKYSDCKLFQALKKDGISITEQEIQNARNNDNETLYKIGEEYHKKEKYKTAFAWFHKAALRDYAEAQARVGWMCQEGEGVPQDYKQYMNWIMKAAYSGNPEAQRIIGHM